MNLYDAGVTPMIDMLTNMKTWLDKASAEGADEAKLMEARLAPDMLPFPRQFQIASDTAKGGLARIAGVEAPAMADEEASFAELKARLDKTIAFLGGVDRATVEASADRPVEMKFPNGMRFAMTGAEHLTHFVLPNFYFHVTTAYALLRANGVGMGKPDYLAAMGRFAQAPAS